MRMLVETYENVIESVRAFNRGLQEGLGLEGKLSYFRAWYYVPELDLVGPSKFIGYKGITVAQYMNDSGELDGRETEAVLSQWFDPLTDATPEARYVENLVEDLLNEYNKRLNDKARFNAKRGWSLSQGRLAPSLANAEESTSTGPQPIVEVFWRAFLSLYPEDQSVLAERIIKHLHRS